MKKNKLLLLSSSFLITTPMTVLSAGCNQNKIDYDLGLVSEPINSLNYIKYNSTRQILPSLVDAPLKDGPNASLKNRLNLPAIDLGLYGSSDRTIDETLKNNENSLIEKSGRSYDLKNFGGTTGTLTSDNSVYHNISGITTKENNFLSLHILLNQGASKWSNNDLVTADDYVDYVHYIFDISTGSQKLTDYLQRKFKSSKELIDAQQEYIKVHKTAYKNPFQYPKLINVKGQWIYDVFDKNYKLFGSQNSNDDKEVKKIKDAVNNLGFKSGRMYWNYSNKEILSAIPYSPDFNPEAEITVLMLPNPEYSTSKHTADELKKIPQRIATKVRKYLYYDQRQKTSDKFNELIEESKILKSKIISLPTFDGTNSDTYNKIVNDAYKKLSNPDVLNNLFIQGLNVPIYFKYKTFAFDEYSLRVEYNDYEPADISGVYRDLENSFIPINRKFVESIGGVNEFGLDKKRFLTTSAFKIDELVLGPQGYLILKKDKSYYMANKTISNKIKIWFSSDPNINGILFDDRYIAATKIPAVQQLQYWTDPKKRQYMTKQTGFGTIALAFNLDKETNGNSLLQDNNLRNAIYYAINRDDMLNIVGWNSSYPVITWTAFGQAKSSYGDPLELAFDHDFMKPKHWDNSKGVGIPVENYSHIDHLSKEYKFEHVDRTDKGYQLDIARAYMDDFKKAHPDVSKVHLKYISNSTDEHQKAGLALQDFAKKAFGNYLEIEIKSLPENVYEDYKSTGKFDLMYGNFDKFGQDAYSYIGAFFNTDGIDTKNQKTIGFRYNPAGSWTYEEYFKSLGYYYDSASKTIKTNNPTLAEATRKRLFIDTKTADTQDVWNKVIELSFKKDDEKLDQYRERYLKFFTNQFTDKESKDNWTERNSFSVINAFEKIIRDGAPVVPLMEVDTYWLISRVNGVQGLYSYQLQFAYDVEKLPQPGLPTIIKEG